MSSLGGVVFCRAYKCFFFPPVVACGPRYPSMKSMRRTNPSGVIFGVLICLAACQPVRGVTTLAREMKGQFHRPILVSVNHWNELVLVVPADTSDPRLLGRTVAQYAAEHYGYRSQLKTVTVIVDGGETSSAYNSYTWGVGELSSAFLAPVPGKPGRPD